MKYFFIFDNQLFGPISSEFGVRNNLTRFDVTGNLSHWNNTFDTFLFWPVGAYVDEEQFIRMGNSYGYWELSELGAIETRPQRFDWCYPHPIYGLESSDGISRYEG